MLVRLVTYYMLATILDRTVQGKSFETGRLQMLRFGARHQKSLLSFRQIISWTA